MRKKKEERKSEVFKAIAEIASEKGFSNITTKAVADRLGVTQPAIYKYFKNREDLIIYFLDNVGVYLENIISLVNQEKSLKEKILCLYKEHFRMVENNEILPIMVFSDEIHVGNIHKKEKLRSIVLGYRENIVKSLDGCYKKETIADVILGSIIFNALKWKLNNKSYSLIEIANELADVILKICT